MGERRLWAGLLIVALIGCAPVSQPGPVSVTPPSPTPKPQLKYRTYSLPEATVHVLRIPSTGFQVVPAVATGVEPLEEFARRSGAIAVINGGFFDPDNQLSTSYVVVQGKQVADPQQNPQLTQNPRLVLYLEQIWNRSEFRRYQCAQTTRYGFATHRQPPPVGCQIVDALGGGPRLLPELTARPEAFLAVRQGQVIRDPIGVEQPNARSAIGMNRQGELVWVMVAQDPARPGATGMSLPRLAQWLRSLGVEEALNLDGGSSAALYYQGRTFSGKVNSNGEPVQRPVKSVLLLQKTLP